MPRCRLALTLLLALPLTGRAADGLAAKIEEVTQSPAYRQAGWGILVADAATGEPLYTHNADRLFAPASVTKLYSCAAALAALGPGHRFETPVYLRGPLEEGRLRGDLILVASGDPTLGGRTTPDGKLAFRNTDHIYAGGASAAELTDTDPLAGLTDLARQVAKHGVKSIAGEVLIDDRLFDRARGSGSGPDMVTPIMVNDNLIDVVVTPATEVGQPATVRMRPENTFYQMDAQVRTIEGTTTSVNVEIVGPQRFAVRGRVGVKAKPTVAICPVDNPNAWARALFIDALRAAGVAVTASALQPPRAELPEPTSYARFVRAAVHTSPPFSEVVKVTLKVSHNLYASTLPLMVAAKAGKRSLVDGMRAQRKFLDSVGVDVSTISFGGGAGGDRADATTPTATVQLLRGMRERPDFATYRDGLPVLGIDGTLAEAVPMDSPAKGKVRAKTGTLYWQDVMNERMLLQSKALAGYLTTSSGRELCFALFVNDLPLGRGVPPSREGKTLGRLCEVIYQEVK